MNSLATNRGGLKFQGPGYLTEIIVLVVASAVCIGLFTYLPLAVPWLRDYSSALIAAAFIYLPAAALWRRNQFFPDVGVKVRPLKVRSLLVVIAVVFPLFAAGFMAYHGLLFQRSLCLDPQRLAAWSDSLYSPDLSGMRDGLVLNKNDRDELLLVNNSGRAQELSIGWKAPSGLVRLAAPTEGSRTAYLRTLRNNGKTTRLPDGRMVVFALAGDDAWVRVDSPHGAGELWAGNRDQEALPFETHKGYGWLLTFLAVQLLLIALPEEIFYRGYLQTRLQGVFKRRWVVLGGDVGPAVLVTSALFALGHLVAIPSASRLAVFFPSILFGWLRDRTCSVAGPVILHALSNVLLTVLTRFLCQ